MSTVLSRWTAKLHIRRGLEKTARVRHVAHPTTASRALLELRKAQVREAEKVVARHRRITTVSRKGVALIKEFEGFRSRPYQDSVGVWTIGYGHTEGVTRATAPLTEKQASELLRRDLDKKYAPYDARLELPLNQHQFDALVSFVYNLGPGYLAAGHTMGDALRRHDWKAAASAFLLYTRAGDRSLPGLVRRRKAERDLFVA